ncbi:cache domain-containing protein, partial [Vibrio sp. 10N.222.55.E8]
MIKKILMMLIVSCVTLIMTMISYFGFSTYNLLSDLNRVRVEQILDVQGQVVSKLEQLAQSGYLPEPQAKHVALEILKGIDYSDTEYVWVASKEEGEPLRFVSTPRDPQFQGMPFVDVSGQDTERALISNLSNSRGSEVVNYTWELATDGVVEEVNTVALKTSDWGWFMGNGIKTKDIIKDVKSSLLHYFFWVSGFCMLLIIIIFFVIRREFLDLPLIVSQIDSLAGGNLSQVK